MLNIFNNISAVSRVDESHGSHYTCRLVTLPLPLVTGCARTWHVMKTKFHARCVGSTWEQHTWQITWRSIVKDQAISALSVTEVMKKLFYSSGMGQHSRGALWLCDSLQQEEVIPYLCTYSAFPTEYLTLKLMEYRSGLFTWQTVPKEAQFISEANFIC